MSGRTARQQTALRWAGYVAIAIVFAIVCAFLSNWQFTRNADRSSQLALIAANYDAAPVPLDQVIGTDGTFPPADQWRPVTLTGEYLTDRTLLARNRAHGGTSAFEVLVPFRTVEGAVFLIDRGWLPPGSAQPEPDTIPAPPSGQVQVVARLKPGEPLPNSGRSAPDGQVPTINLPLVAETTAQPTLITSAYGLLVSEQPSPSQAPNALESPSDDPGPYLSYAIQWILFALMGFVFIWYMIRTEIRHRREDAEDAAAAASAEVAETASPEEADPSAAARRRRQRETRRRDRDMQEEDALLDELTPR
ncbi:cytochrome oxidase assembly protein ShyY1 [Microbacterium sp. AG790]|uniref:SURF1 family cytochrome oxidase biogenesis protein n=1 Tax=Microbacterium sp. AG790 TaxID=2183995 RepID=UPI000EB483CB|nr:SURF1 family protein [Microbacterium sp. AG790]RKS89437.1 cytochrome oxidase assembly protein ShyY1 [Microbacterium sp. AG790]